MWFYRYPTTPGDCQNENPVDEHNHALAALRYLIATLDAGRMVQPLETATSTQQESKSAPAASQPDNYWQRIIDDERYWIPLGPGRGY